MSRLISTTLLLVLPLIALAHESPGYSHRSEAGTSNPRWMTALRDDTKLSELSIPGTHDTMAFYGGDIVQTQSMSLEAQLRGGIRVLDIRCRRIENTFAIHHGPVFQKVFFGDVLNTVIRFLSENPGETVLMRVKEEHTAERNSETFEETFSRRYWIPHQSSFWQPSSNNPTLGEIRGRIVVLQNFKADAKYGIDYGSIKTQDKYRVSDNWALYDKWVEVRRHLNDADTGDANMTFMNYLSGSGGSFPYFVASGHSSKGTGAPRLATGLTTPGWKDKYPDFPRVDCVIGICTIAFEGTNVLAYQRIGKKYTRRVGMVMADFPGPGLIERVIHLNDRFRR